MFTRIMVPLDGSLRAERALTVAARIALASHGSIVLLQVVGLPVEYSTYAYGGVVAQSPLMTQDMLETAQAQAQAYLSSISSSRAWQVFKPRQEW